MCHSLVATRGARRAPASDNDDLGDGSGCRSSLPIDVRKSWKFSVDVPRWKCTPFGLPIVMRECVPLRPAQKRVCVLATTPLIIIIVKRSVCAIWAISMKILWLSVAFGWRP